MKKISHIALAFLVLTVVACDKKDDLASRTELLTNGSWTLTAVVSDDDGNGSYETDDYALFPACFKDNYYSFFANGSAEVNEGAMKCDPTDPQTESTNWQFTQNETHLMIDGDEWVLVELSASTLKWKEEYGGGISSLVTMTKR